MVLTIVGGLVLSIYGLVGSVLRTGFLVSWVLIDRPVLPKMLSWLFSGFLLEPFLLKSQVWIVLRQSALKDPLGYLVARGSLLPD